MRTIYHYRRETHLYAGFAKLKRIAVIQMKNNRNIASQLLCILNCALRHISQYSLIGILSCTGRYLKNNRRLCLYASLNNSLHLLHVVEIEGWNSIASLNRFGKHLPGVYQS